MVSTFFLLSFFPRLISAVGDWMSTMLPRCGLCANLECRSEMSCTRLAENTGRKKSPFSHNRTTLPGCIFTAEACIYNRKKVLTSNISSTRPRNMMNFGPLAAGICWRVLGTPPNFNGFRVLAALLHDTTSGRQPNFAALNRGRFLYSAGRPSRWALTHM